MSSDLFCFKMFPNIRKNGRFVRIWAIVPHVANISNVCHTVLNQKENQNFVLRTEDLQTNFQDL